MFITEELINDILCGKTTTYTYADSTYCVNESDLDYISKYYDNSMWYYASIDSLEHNDDVDNAISRLYDIYLNLDKDSSFSIFTDTPLKRRMREFYEELKNRIELAFGRYYIEYILVSQMPNNYSCFEEQIKNEDCISMKWDEIPKAANF